MQQVFYPGSLSGRRFSKKEEKKIHEILDFILQHREGHNAAARAVQEELTRQGHEAVLQDMMLLAGPHVARAVGGGYVGTVQHAPRLFSALYDAGSHLSSARRRSPVYYANALVAGRLERLLARGRFDGVVTTHLFCAETLTWLKRHGRLHVPCLAVATDYTCIPFWEETDCDRYVIPHPELTDEFAGGAFPAAGCLLLAFRSARGSASRWTRRRPGPAAACRRTAGFIWSWAAAWDLARSAS